MTNEEAIKYLKQLYPNGGHCWLDEQRIAAIGMAVKALQKEPANDGFEVEVKKLWEEINTGHSYSIVDSYNIFYGLCMDIANWQKEQQNIIEPIGGEQVKESLISKHDDKICKENGNSLTQKSETIDFEQELYKYFGQIKDFTLGMRIAKRFYEIGRNHQESVSEDLKQAIDTYLATYFGGEKEKQDWPFLKKIAIHFANWQKKQDQSTIELAEDHAMLAGMEKMKEQMMKEAVDGTVFTQLEDGEIMVRSHYFKSEKFNYLDEVKLIIIKED